MVPTGEDCHPLHCQVNPVTVTDISMSPLVWAFASPLLLTSTVTSVVIIILIASSEKESLGSPTDPPDHLSVVRMINCLIYFVLTMDGGKFGVAVGPVA